METIEIPEAGYAQTTSVMIIGSNVMSTKPKPEPRKPTNSVDRIMDASTPVFDSERGVRLRYARHAMKLKQSDLAKLLGVSQKTVSRLEIGLLDVGGFSTLLFRSVMGKHFGYVMFGTGKEKYESFRHCIINKFGTVILHS